MLIKMSAFFGILAHAVGTPAMAQSDTLPSSTSTAGISIMSSGRSIKPAELTPTRIEPYRPRPWPPAQERNGSIPGASITVFGR